MQKLITKLQGGEKASRNNPRIYSKQKEIQLEKKLSFLRKHLSLETAKELFSISKNLKSLQKVWTMGDVTAQVRIHKDSYSFLYGNPKQSFL